VRGDGIVHRHGGTGGLRPGLGPGDDLGHAWPLGQPAQFTQQVRLHRLPGSGGLPGKFIPDWLRDIPDLNQWHAFIMHNAWSSWGRIVRDNLPGQLKQEIETPGCIAATRSP
jgi:hypothetical protein